MFPNLANWNFTVTRDNECYSGCIVTPSLLMIAAPNLHLDNKVVKCGMNWLRALEYKDTNIFIYNDPMGEKEFELDSPNIQTRNLFLNYVNENRIFHMTNFNVLFELAMLTHTDYGILSDLFKDSEVTKIEFNHHYFNIDCTTSQAVLDAEYNPDMIYYINNTKPNEHIQIVIEYMGTAFTRIVDQGINTGG